MAFFSSFLKNICKSKYVFYIFIHQLKCVRERNVGGDGCQGPPGGSTLLEPVASAPSTRGRGERHPGDTLWG